MITRLRAWVYIRESKEELLRGYSPDEMVSQCREKAEKLGADVERVIVEAGKRDEFDCPGLLEAITAAKAGEYDLLISYDMYRLSGELGKHIWVKEQIGATAVTIHYVVGEYAPGPEGELLETVQAAVGRYERMKTRARTQNGITGKLKREQPIGNGPTPYGLEKVYDETTKRPIGYRPTKQLDVVKRIIRDLQEPDGTLVKVCPAAQRRGDSDTGRGAALAARHHHVAARECDLHRDVRMGQGQADRDAPRRRAPTVQEHAEARRRDHHVLRSSGAEHGRGRAGKGGDDAAQARPTATATGRFRPVHPQRALAVRVLSGRALVLGERWVSPLHLPARVRAWGQS